jgi:hypothetical protein
MARGWKQWVVGLSGTGTVLRGFLQKTLVGTLNALQPSRNVDGLRFPANGRPPDRVIFSIATTFPWEDGVVFNASRDGQKTPAG